MAYNSRINNRDALKQYCLRKLGAPVLKIDCADEQLEDRIDEAFQFYYDRNYDATESDWFAYKLTETDIRSGYIKLPNEYIDVLEVMPSSLFNWQMSNMIDQFYTSNFIGGGSVDQVSAFVSMKGISEFKMTFETTPRFRFNRHMHTLRIQQDLDLKYNAGDLITFKACKQIDPDEYPDMYNDVWLKKYVTALFKRQWGENLIKFNNVVLLGGVTTNGEQLYAQAEAEIAKLEDDLQNIYQDPVMPFMG